MVILTREDGLNVPGHDAIEEGVKVHEEYGGGEAEVVLLHGAGEQVAPLDAHPLLLEQGKVLTAKAKRHRGQQALLRGRGRWKEGQEEREVEGERG